MTKKPTRPELESWDALNQALMKMDEAAAKTLLERELTDKRRAQFVKRIHSRINKLRAVRERTELEARVK